MRAVSASVLRGSPCSCSAAEGEAIAAQRDPRFGKSPGEGRRGARPGLHHPRRRAVAPARTAAPAPAGRFPAAHAAASIPRRRRLEAIFPGPGATCQPAGGGMRERTRAARWPGSTGAGENAADKLSAASRWRPERAGGKRKEAGGGGRLRGPAGQAASRPAGLEAAQQPRRQQKRRRARRSEGCGKTWRNGMAGPASR